MDEGWYRLLSVVTLVLGFWQGPMALGHRLFADDRGTVMRAANYLPAPWCYLVAGTATVLCVALLAVLDSGRKKALARAGGTTG